MLIWINAAHVFLKCISLTNVLWSFLLQHFKLLACLYVVSYIIDTVARGKYILPGNDLNVFMTYIIHIVLDSGDDKIYHYSVIFVVEC